VGSRIPRKKLPEDRRHPLRGFSQNSISLFCQKVQFFYILEQEKVLNSALNKIIGEWNKELLVDLIKDLQDSDFDIAFTGFEPPEIEQL